MKQILKREGFSEGFFKTPDSLNLDYLYLHRSDAQYNVVLCSGWLPGRKESSATLYALLPPTCNLLLFDARGHGKSEGPLLREFWLYGVNEYKDIIGALTFLKKQNSLPTIIWGLCSGAFHATRALAVLNEQKKLSLFNVRGLIFDSGWSSVEKAAYTAPRARLHEYIHILMGKLTRRHKKDPHIKKMPVTRMLSSLLDVTYNTIYATLFYPFHKPYRHRASLTNAMDVLPIPILFIHAKDDRYVHVGDTQRLAKRAQQPTCWWIDKPSRHSCHHTKHNEAYEQQLTVFINSLAL